MSATPPLRALVVEENPAARQAMLRVVRESFSDDIVFSEAADLDAARRVLGLDRPGASAPPDFRLVVCDIESAEGEGLELLAQLRDHPAIRIATTLHSDDDHLFPALQCGADGYLLKEDRFEVLVEELQKIARGQPSLSPAMARRMLNFFREIDAGGAEGGASTRPSLLDGLSGSGALDTALDGYSVLGVREREVLSRLSKGYAVKEIARQLGIPWFAVNDHVRAACRKLALASSPEAALLKLRSALAD